MERFMRSWKLLFLSLLASTVCFAAQPDRLTGQIESSQMVALKGNVHGLAQPRFDIGRADGSKLIHGVTLAFQPSAAQRLDLNNLLAQQQDRSSPNYHRWLTPAQFADRFGMTQGDIRRIVAWLESQGFSVTSVANSRNQISFDGTVAQIETVFATEIHDYLVDGEIHFANATNPSVPAALAGLVLAVGHLHNFSPKPRVKFSRKSYGSHPEFTSYISGNHFLSPGDFATIYDVQPLYSAGIDGTGQSIAIIGQSSVSATDLSNFRSAAGLPARAPTYVIYPSTSTSTRCAGDEGESDLDLEWSGGVAKNADIIFVYAGLITGDTCTNRTYDVWDALQQTVDHNYAPIISTSYGYCEAGLGSAFANDVRGWVLEANSQGQTVMAASGDSGAADCDGAVASATQGLAVDVPAAIPEVTGTGGTEFDGDSEATVTNGNASSTTYWTGTTGGTDAISSAISFIPEMGWNDTVEDDLLSASGGGASVFFTKPTWQTGTGVPSGSQRDVPDIALNASPDHDPYLFCSEDGENGTLQTTCTSGFRDGSGGDLAAVGGTSCAAPTFSAILALLSQDFGLSGLGNINPNLYSLAASSPTAFHDVTVGSNIVPCTSGTTDCPSGTVQFGFSAGVGYDQVTGLGSVDANNLAVAWKATLAPDFALSANTLIPTSIPAGQSAASTLTISPVTGSTKMTVNFAPSSCTGLPSGAACAFNPTSVYFDGTDPVTTTLTISTSANMAPSGPTNVTITPTNSSNTTATVSLTVTATTESFTLTPNANTYTVAAGGTAPVSIAVTGTNGFIVGSGAGATTALPLTYSCTGVPSLSVAEINCQLPNFGQPTNATAVTVSFVTTAPTKAQLRPPLGHSQIFYALLLPGLFGIVFVAGSRTRGLRLLSLIVVLGFSTLWLGSCGSGGGGGTTTPPNPGTPVGSYAVTINATTGGANPLTYSMPITLTVTAQ
jgi:subtilase family serine protease